jgi:hypothetical protein
MHTQWPIIQGVNSLWIPLLALEAEFSLHSRLADIFDVPSFSSNIINAIHMHFLLCSMHARSPNFTVQTHLLHI